MSIIFSDNYTLYEINFSTYFIILQIYIWIDIEVASLSISNRKPVTSIDQASPALLFLQQKCYIRKIIYENLMFLSFTP